MGTPAGYYIGPSILGLSALYEPAIPPSDWVRMVVFEDVTNPKHLQPCELFENGIGGLAADLKHGRIYRVQYVFGNNSFGWYLYLTEQEGNISLVTFNMFGSGERVAEEDAGGE